MSALDEFSGSLKFDLKSFEPSLIPPPTTLVIYMTKGERRIRDEFDKRLCGVKRIVINVDGECHEYDADSLIRMLEKYEAGQARKESE